MTGGLWDYRASVLDYRESTWTLDRDLVGYRVESPDGPLGVVVRASSASAAAYLVVDAGPAIAGLRLVPAGAVTSMHHDGRAVLIALTRGQVEAAPTYEDDNTLGGSVRAEHDRYFSNLDLR
jgi:hypothetical protein